MSTELLTALVNLMAFGVLATTILLIVRRSLPGQVQAFALQSWGLALLALVIALWAGNLELLGVAVLVFLVKGLVIPRVLQRAVANLGLEHSALPYLSTPIALSVCGSLVVVAFYVMGPVTASNSLPTAGAIPLAFAGVLIGLFVTVNRRRALTQILGFLTLESGIFLFALLATYGVPFVVEIGVFIDVLVAVLIMEVFIYRIKDNFDSIDVGRMGELKG